MAAQINSTIRPAFRELKIFYAAALLNPSAVPALEISGLLYLLQQRPRLIDIRKALAGTKQLLQFCAGFSLFA